MGDIYSQMLEKEFGEFCEDIRDRYGLKVANKFLELTRQLEGKVNLLRLYHVRDSVVREYCVGEIGEFEHES